MHEIYWQRCLTDPYKQQLSNESRAANSRAGFGGKTLKPHHFQPGWCRSADTPASCEDQRLALGFEVLWGCAAGVLTAIVIFFLLFFLIIKRHPGNYRSMSSLSDPAKLIVKLIKDRRVQQSDKHNMTGSIQYGFWGVKLCLSELQVFIFLSLIK